MSRAQELKRQLSLALQQSEWQEALGFLQNLVDSQDCQPGYYNQLGDLHLKLGDRSSAIASFLRGVESYRNLGMLPNGAALCKKIVRIEPDQKEAIWILGELKTRQGFLADGGDRLLEALRLYAEDPGTERQTLVDRMGEAEQLQGSNREMLEFVATTYAQIGERELARDVTIRIADFEERAGRHENAQTMRRLAEQYVPEETGTHGETAHPVAPAGPNAPTAPTAHESPDQPTPEPEGQSAGEEAAIPAMDLAPALPGMEDERVESKPAVIIDEDPEHDPVAADCLQLESAIESVGGPSGVTGEFESLLEPDEPIEPDEPVEKIWSIDPDELPDPIQAVEDWERAAEESPEVLTPAPSIEETIQPLARPVFDSAHEVDGEIQEELEPAASGPAPSMESFPGAFATGDSLDYLSLTGGPSRTENGGESVREEDSQPEDTGVGEFDAFVPNPSGNGAQDPLSVGLSIHDSCPIQTDDALDVLNEFRSRLEEQADAMSADERYQLGVSYMEMELHAEALTEFAHTLEDEQLGTKTREWMARCYVALDRPNDVLALLEAHLAADASPNRDSVELYYLLGQAYEALDEPRLAVGSFMAVQQLDPEFRDAAARLAKLRALT